MMNIELKKILLVEDNPNDAELTLEALGSHGLANQVDHVHDGDECPTTMAPPHRRQLHLPITEARRQ
jgi:CheY-like chemotaxis protein